MIKEKAGKKTLNISLLLKTILAVLLYFLKIFKIFDLSWGTIGVLTAFAAFEYWGSKYFVKVMENKY